MINIRPGQVTDVRIDSEWFAVKLGTFFIEEWNFGVHMPSPFGFVFESANNDKVMAGPVASITAIRMSKDTNG